MPYPNEHAARLADPKGFDAFRRTAGGTLYGRIDVPKTIGIIWGIKGTGAKRIVRPQSLRFPVKNWSVAKAKKWLADHKIAYKQFEPAKAATKGEATMPDDMLCDAIELVAEEPIDLTAAEGEKKPRFSGLAYSGGQMRIAGFYWPVVIDVAGMVIGRRKKPVLRNHDPNQIVGHTRAVSTDGGQIRIEGIVSGSGEAAREVVETGVAGFPWKLSVGASIEKREQIDPGGTTEVNGRRFSGPLVVVRKARLGEISFVPVAADPQTSAAIAAEAHRKEGGAIMPKKSKSNGSTDAGGENIVIDQAAGSADASPDLRNDAQLLGSAPEGAIAGSIEEFRRQQAVETERIATVRRLCSGRHAEIEAEAIRDGWDSARTELAILRAERAAGPAIHSTDRTTDRTTLEACIRLAGEEREDNLAREYDEQTMDRARRYRGIGFRGLVDLACRLEGMPSPQPGASPIDLAAAGFATASLSGILGASATKSLLAAYRSFTSAARAVAKKLTAADFKTHTGYRLTGDFKMEQVGASGELKQATIDEESFTYSVKTYGRIFGITREMLINDDLGAFTEIPRMLGRGAALALEDAFFTLVLANTGSFFSAGNNNYVTGAAYALSSEGLRKAIETMRKQTDADGHPIELTPRFLLVPPELEQVAMELFSSQFLIVSGGSAQKRVPQTNLYQGKHEPVVSAYLSNSSYSGYSAAAYYLLADPADSAAFGIAYLNGQESPVIEDAPLQADLLGKAWRGYFDFGVAQVDKRAGVKMKGEA